MTAKAFTSAKDKLRVTREKLELLKATDSLATAADAWSDFVTQAQRTFQRLQKATEKGSSKAWSDQIKNARKTDPLLSYVWQARNAEDHGLGERITEVDAGGFGINAGPSGYIEHLRIRSDGSTTEIEYRGDDPPTLHRIPARLKLVRVTNRGEVYDPPTEHLGQPLRNVTPAGVADLAFTYLQKMIAEAEDKFGAK
jgi:hypothetical protein